MSLILGCPDVLVARQVLYIDLPAREVAVAGYQTAIREALRAGRPKRTGFKDVRPCADHRLHGGIIQAADMIAGEARARGGLLGPYLPRLGSRVVLVQAEKSRRQTNSLVRLDPAREQGRLRDGQKRYCVFCGHFPGHQAVAHWHVRPC